MGLALAQRCCHQKFTVAVARKLAVIMPDMRSVETFYVGHPAVAGNELATRRSEKDRRLLGVDAC